MSQRHALSSGTDSNKAARTGEALSIVTAAARTGEALSIVTAAEFSIVLANSYSRLSDKRDKYLFYVNTAELTEAQRG